MRKTKEKLLVITKIFEYASFTQISGSKSSCGSKLTFGFQFCFFASNVDLYHLEFVSFDPTLSGGRD